MADLPKLLLEPFVWSATPVEDSPRLRLTQWRVMQIARGGCHLVGWNSSEREGRVSTAIVSMNASTREALTASGRVYELAGRPGFNADAEHTWGWWCRLNDVEQYVDITAQIEAAISSAERRLN